MPGLKDSARDDDIESHVPLSPRCRGRKVSVKRHKTRVQKMGPGVSTGKKRVTIKQAVFTYLSLRHCSIQVCKLEVGMHTIHSS